MKAEKICYKKDMKYEVCRGGGGGGGHLISKSGPLAARLVIIHSLVRTVDPVLSGKARNVACGPLKYVYCYIMLLKKVIGLVLDIQNNTLYWRSKGGSRIWS